MKEAMFYWRRAGGQVRCQYEGNVSGEGGNYTCCPSCASLLIERYGLTVEANRIGNGVCPECIAPIAGIGR